MQCNHCGASIFATDQFCMECGQPISAQPATPSQPPTWLPVAAAAPSAHNQVVSHAAERPQAARAAQAGDTVTCPNCASHLPRGARFCGDCGTPLPDTSSAAPAQARPPRVAAAALPAPIPPFHAGTPKAASGPVQAVLPPFQPSSWETETETKPDVHLPDGTMTPLSNKPAAPPNGQAAPGWASPPAPAPWAVPPEPVWQPGQLQGSSKAAEFQPPGVFPQPQAAAAPALVPFQPQPAASPSQAFFQAISAIPPMAPDSPATYSRRKRGYPRGQVITMIVAGIVTVLAALGGVLVLLLAR
jgi:hypothetical protein